MAGMKQYDPTTRGPHMGKVRFRCSWRNSEGRQLGKTKYGRSSAERFCRDMEKGFINIDTGIYKDVEMEQVKQTVRDAVIETRQTRTFGKLASRFLSVKREENFHSPATLEDYKQQLDIHIMPTLGECDCEIFFARGS